MPGIYGSVREVPCVAAQASAEIVVQRQLIRCPAGSRTYFLFLQFPFRDAVGLPPERFRRHPAGDDYDGLISTEELRPDHDERVSSTV